MSDQNPTTDEPMKPIIRLNLGALEMAEKITEVRAMQPEIGSSRQSIEGILDILELLARTVHGLETSLVGR